MIKGKKLEKLKSKLDIIELKSKNFEELIQRVNEITSEEFGEKLEEKGTRYNDIPGYQTMTSAKHLWEKDGYCGDNLAISLLILKMDEFNNRRLDLADCKLHSLLLKKLNNQKYPPFISLNVRTMECVCVEKENDELWKYLKKRLSTRTYTIILRIGISLETMTMYIKASKGKERIGQMKRIRNLAHDIFNKC